MANGGHARAFVFCDLCRYFPPQAHGKSGETYYAHPIEMGRLERRTGMPMVKGDVVECYLNHEKRHGVSSREQLKPTKTPYVR